MNYDTYFQIALNLDLFDLIEFCRTSKELSNICEDKFFFTTKARLDLGVSRKEFEDVDWQENFTPMLRYIQLHTLYKGVTYGSQNFLPLKHCMYNALDQNNERLIDYFMFMLKRQGKSIKDYKGLYHSIIGNNYEMFLYFANNLYQPRKYLNDLNIISNQEIFSRAIDAKNNRNIFYEAAINARKYDRKDIYRIVYILEQNMSKITNILFLLYDKITPESELKSSKYQGEDLDSMIRDIDLDVNLYQL